MIISKLTDNRLLEEYEATNQQINVIGIYEKKDVLHWYALAREINRRNLWDDAEERCVA